MESSYGFLVQYVAAKSGVVGISQSLARELKPLGININCVLPGGMLSPGAMHGAPTPELREATKDGVRAPVTDPDDVARVVFMMTTGISDYMHGSTIVADGGARVRTAARPWTIQPARPNSPKLTPAVPLGAKRAQSAMPEAVPAGLIR